MRIIQPTILRGNCMEVISGKFNLITFMPPWNMPRRHNDEDRGYPDNQDELSYQADQIEKLRWTSAHLLPSGLVAYHHRNRIKNHRLIIPEMWILKQDDLVLWDTVVIYKGSTQNPNKGRGYPMREHVYLLYRRGDDPKKIYSNSTPDAYSAQCFDSRSDTWFFPAVTAVWHGSTHRAVAPEILPYRILKRWCPPEGSVCDPNMGSGTTAIAAMKLGLKFTGCEILHKYYKETLARINALIKSSKV